MKKCFYVLFNSKHSAFYIDNQFFLTNDVLIAERYKSITDAQKELSYFKQSEGWEPKKVTVTVTL